ncbi:adhesion G-protein coupled receptor F1-like isoform X1 [Chiloscyllium plagiosum]|uniref:adhesion G-protein coupled receptor F1-like isoform X1 n=1 Tax=Chiloscyllium plagiosum TaxID=36176 RepID=UPI001CB83321|nr:adhesion G-protein coupled receptor F1-like isoform X1 [Chiloscyllium plagiosum]
MLQYQIVLPSLLLLLISQRAEFDCRSHSSNSSFLADDPSLKEDSNNNFLRNVYQQLGYKLDIVLEKTEAEISDSDLKYLLEHTVYPINLQFEFSTINIHNIIPTTVCQIMNNETQCMCENGFTWNSTFCSKYKSCCENVTEGQRCDCIRGEPIEGTYCEPTYVVTTPTPSTVSTSTTPTAAATTAAATTTLQSNLRKNFAFRIFNLTFTDELSQASSTLFKSHSRTFQGLLQTAYRNVQRDATVNILGFTNGSVIVLHQVISEEPLTKNIEKVRENVRNAFSPNYTIEWLQDDEIPCFHETYGITNYNTCVEVPCENKTGIMKIRCGKNGMYKLDFCISEEIYKILEVTKGSNLEDIFSSLLRNLSIAVTEVNVNTAGNIQAVVDILTSISNLGVNVTETDMTHFLKTVSEVLSSQSIEAWRNITAVNGHSASSQLLKSVENFNIHFRMQNDTFIKTEINLVFKAYRNRRRFIDETFHNISAEYSNLSANVFISSDEFKDKPNATVIIVAYPVWIDILPNTTTFDGNFLINSLVLTLNISKPINVKMTFSPRNRTLDFNTAVCGFWDFTGRGAWNDTGCKSEINEENITCHCDHFTSFSILMSPDTKDSPALNYITSIGVAISIGSLLITIIIEAIVWKHVTKNKTSYIRHVGILNIAVNLLVADVWFIVASAVEPGTRACTAATFFIHFFYLALFFWMLTLGLLLAYRLLFPFHDLSRSVMMGISFAVGYLPPLIISIITIGVTFPRNSYTREGACWLGWETEYPLLAFVIPALVIIAINVIILFIVIFKLLRPTIGDRSRANNQEREMFKRIVRSVAVLTPILGLTWAFGIPTFQQGSPVAFHYIFTILNAFQGFFILVFGTFMDNKVREALLKKISMGGFSSIAKLPSSSSGAKPSSTPHHSFRSRKKNYNISDQLHFINNTPSPSSLF